MDGYVEVLAAERAKEARRVAVLGRILGVGAPPDIDGKINELAKGSPWRREEIVEILIQRALSMQPMPWDEVRGA